MGKIWMPGGGGGIDLDVITAAAGDVLKGKVIVDKDGNPLTGTLELTGNAGPGDVLAGKGFYNTDPKSKRTGTMVDRKNWSSSDLAAGASVTIPAGKHDGSGKVTAKSLASQTGEATAEDKYVYKGKTYWKDGVKRTGSMTVPSVLSFSAAAYSTSQVTCTWKNPGAGPFGGVIIRYKTGGYPTSVTDGSGYQGTGSSTAANGTSSTTIGGLSAGQTYYFRIWAYCETSAGTLYSGYREVTCKVTAHGQVTIKSSQNWTVPAGVRSIDILCVGGGGGGAGADVWRTGSDHSYTVDCTSGGGGAGGYVVTKTGVAVTPGATHYATIGSGGSAGKYSYSTDDSVSGGPTSGGNGGTTSLGSLCSAAGGKGATGRAGGAGGTGSAAGGAGARDEESSGRNGENGTSAFGVTCGGGGGGGNYSLDDDGIDRYGNRGSGGLGGGGTGGHNTNGSGQSPASGGANTGGGGGGGWVRKNGSYGSGSNGAAGGSGIIIIKW